MIGEELEEYRPSKDEPYMNQRQLDYFRRKLIDWREELLRESNKTLERLKEERFREADFLDLGSSEAETALELRTRDRYRKLLNKIEAALGRIKDGTYGYCEETGKEIGIKRLEARPVATLCIEAQEKHEQLERQQR
jgi:DnaK suppressor protein